MAFEFQFGTQQQLDDAVAAAREGITIHLSPSKIGSDTVTAGDFANYFDMEFVPVGDPGNVDDDTGYGAVPYSYRIGKYEVSRAMIEAYNANSGGPTITCDMTSRGGNGPTNPPPE